MRKPSQNSSSRDTLVLWPSKTTERFVIATTRIQYAPDSLQNSIIELPVGFNCPKGKALGLGNHSVVRPPAGNTTRNMEPRGSATATEILPL